MFRPYEYITPKEVKLANCMNSCLEILKDDPGSHYWTRMFMDSADEYINGVLSKEFDDLLEWFDEGDRTDVGYGKGERPR